MTFHLQTHRFRILRFSFTVPTAACSLISVARAGLAVTELEKTGSGPSACEEQNGTKDKWI
jgi:hypothetical protein